MLWLYILCGIVLFILLLLASPVKGYISFDGERLKLKLRYLCFFKTVLPPPEDKKKPSEKTNKKKKNQNAGKTEKDGGFKRLTEQKGFCGAVSEICSVIKAAAEKAIKLLGHVKLKHFVLKISITGGDAAEAAVNYGTVCSSVYPLLGFLSAAVCFVKPKTEIFCDYDAKEPSVFLKTTASVSLIFLIGAVLSVLIDLFKNKLSAARMSASANPVRGDKAETKGASKL